MRISWYPTMAVVNTASPRLVPRCPKPVPGKAVPSSRRRMPSMAVEYTRGRDIWDCGVRIANCGRQRCLLPLGQSSSYEGGLSIVPE